MRANYGYTKRKQNTEMLKTRQEDSVKASKLPTLQKYQKQSWLKVMPDDKLKSNGKQKHARNNGTITKQNTSWKVTLPLKHRDEGKKSNVMKRTWAFNECITVFSDFPQWQSPN